MASVLSSQVSGKAKRRRSFWSKKPDETVITGYQIGAIHTEGLILVETAAAVAGDIHAEGVHVRGMVFGHILARQVVIEEDGQVWGDIFTTSLELKPGAKLRGWLHTVEDERFDLYLSGSALPEPAAVPAADLPEPLSAAVNQLSEELPAELTSLLKDLSNEAAVALLARFELESEFDKRLSSISANRLTRAEELEISLDQLKTERNKLQLRISVLSAQLQEQRSENNQAQNEISRLNKELKQKVEHLAQLKFDFQAALEEVQILARERDELSENKRVVTVELETIQERNKGLESALENSLQQNAEQEEALMRWQELAETNEMAVKEAHETVENLTLKAKESEKLLEKLHRRNEELQADRDSTVEEIETLKSQLTDQALSSELAQRLGELEEELARKTREIDVSKQTLVESTAAFAQANQTITQLEEELSAAAGSLALLPQLEEQVSLLQAELDELKIANSQTSEMVDRLKSLEEEIGQVKGERETLSTELSVAKESLAAQLETVETLQNNLTETTADLQQTQGRFEELQAERNTLGEKLAEIQLTMASLQRDLTNAKGEISAMEQKAIARIKNHEEDLVYYALQFDEQGHRLAAVQVDLVVKEVALNALQEKFDLQTQELRRFKSGAAHHLRQLKGEIEEKEEELKGLRARIKE